MDNIIIKIKNLTKSFGNFTAVNSISFNIVRGEILGFLGPNGAGKTTTIKMITGLLKISSGEIVIEGTNVERDTEKIKENIGYMSQKFSLYGTLTAVENVEFFSGITGFKREKVKEKISEIKKIIPKGLALMKVDSLPPGIKQKVALFVSLIADPEILLLDEPTSGVDPEVRRVFWQEIYRLKKEGKTILVTTHNLDEVEYADRIIILHRGNIILRGEPDKLLKEHKKGSVEELFKEAIS